MKRRRYVVTTEEDLLNEVMKLETYCKKVMYRRFRINKKEDRDDIFQELLLYMWTNSLPEEMWDFVGWVKFRISQRVSKFLRQEERWQEGRKAYALSFPQMILEQNIGEEKVMDEMAISDFVDFLEGLNMPDYAKEYLYFHYVEGCRSSYLAKEMGRSRQTLHTWKLYFTDKLEKLDEAETVR